MSDTTMNSIGMRDCLLSAAGVEWIVDAVDSDTLHLVGADGERKAVSHDDLIFQSGWSNLGPGAFDWR